MAEQRTADPWRRAPVIRASALAPLVKELDRCGDGASALLERRLLTRDALADPYREIPLAGYVAFVEAAAEAAGDPLFGARTGLQFRPANLGPVGLLLGASATLRRGLERLRQTLTIWQSGASIGLEDEDGLLVWTYRIEDPAIWPRRQDAEYTLASTIAQAREAFGAAGRPLEVHFEHAPPRDAGALARILGVRPLYGQPVNRLVFDRAAADRPQRTEDRELVAILNRHLDDLRQPEGEDGLLGRVRALIALRLGERQVTLPSVAREIGVSPRTLQRKLAEHGASLRDLVRDCRLELGRVQLRDGRASNAEIARTLGYADGTAFWRAFKAGTGIAPSAFRRPEKQDASRSDGSVEGCRSSVTRS